MIVRHAEADRPAGVVDIERPLSARGRADAAAIGAWLADQAIEPGLVICSPSTRTRQTWHGIAPALTGAPEVRYESAVYDDSTSGLVDVLRRTGDDVSTVVLIGHNPSVSDLSERLDPSAGGELRTSGIAVHRYDGDWAALGDGTAELVGTHTARG